MPINTLDRLTRSYHGIIKARVEAQRRRIAALPTTVGLGRVIPDPADLTIGRGRRLQTTILFLDISGFTRRSAETEAEQDILVRILSLFFSTLIWIVGQYGGTVEKNTGDGIMAYFAASGLTGDVRKRALASAMTMFYAADYFINPVIIRSGLAPIDFRICIDYGWVTIARLGAAQRFNHIVAVGATANRTSKMLNYADPNEILLGDAMLGGLPENWREAHLTLKTEHSGWVHVGTNDPYRLWTFNGRWAEPQQ